MRFLVFGSLLSVICSAPVFGQGYFNFLIEGKDVYWQKVYQTDLSIDELRQIINRSDHFRNIQHQDENTIVGDIEKVDLEGYYKDLGFNYMSTPIYLSRSYFHAKAIIQFKEGRYRVTVRKIMQEWKIDDPFNKKGDMSNLDALKKNNTSFKRHFITHGSKILDYAFDKEFNLENSKIVLDDDF